jgi:ABC-2 type transport system permease protein
MSLSLRRIRAIIIKDYKEFSRNHAISIMVLFPILFAFLYRGNGESVTTLFAFVLNFSFAMLTSFVQAALIAEEKERNTLRSLMLTPASTMDVLIGKSLLVFVISAITLAIVTFIFGYEPAHMVVFVIAIALSIILYTGVGTICGLYSKTVLEASLSIFPVIIIFAGAPFGLLLADDYPFLAVLEYAPSSQLGNILTMTTSYTTEQLVKPLLIMFIWTIVLSVVSILLYQKRLKDE